MIYIPEVQQLVLLPINEPMIFFFYYVLIRYKTVL